MRILILLVSFLIPLVSLAATAVRPALVPQPVAPVQKVVSSTENSAESAIASSTTKKSVEPVKKKMTVVLFVASDNRFERGEQMALESRAMLSVGGGLHFSKFLALVEAGTFSDSSGVGNVGVSRKFEQFHFSGAFMPRFKWVSPFVGMGLGQYRDKVETTVAGNSSSSSGKWEPSAAFFAGARVFTNSMFWLSAEGRFVVSSKLDPNPMPGFMFRAGVEF